jgi:hypothetical protein
MNDNATTDAAIRALPIYRLGFDAGRDVGLAIALHTITKEASRQQDLAAIANITLAPSDAYALARLTDLATVVAVYFRTTH